MGCQGSKTAQASNPVEQKAADTTLLKAPVVDSNAVKPQAPGAEAPHALDNESTMGVVATTQKAPETVLTQDAVAPDVAQTGATQDATAAETVETHTRHDSTTSTALENPATQDVTTPKAPEILADLEAASPHDPDAKRQAVDLAAPNDEVMLVKQVIANLVDDQVTEATTETEQRQSSPQPTVEEDAGKLAQVYDFDELVASADQAKVTKVDAVTVPIFGGEKIGCCSRFSLAKERQNELVPQEEVVAPDAAQTGTTQDATVATIVETSEI